MSLPPLSLLTAPPLPSALPPLVLSLSPAEAAKLPPVSPVLPASAAKITANPATPVPPRSATVVASQPLAAAQGGGAALTLQLADGTLLKATSPVPVAVGSTLNLSVQGQTVQGGTAVAQALPGTQTATLIATLTNGLNTPSSAATATPTVAAGPLTGATGALPPNLPVPLATLVLPSPAAGVQQRAPAGTVLAGPLVMQLAQPLPAAWADQPLTLRLTSPTEGLLQPPAPRNGAATLPNTPTAARPLAVTLPAGMGLPLRQDISLQLGESTIITPKNAPLFANTQNSTSLTLAFVTNTQDFTVSSPSPAPWLAALRVMIPPALPAGTYLGRALIPPTGSPQPLVLANGMVAQVEGPDIESTAATGPLPTARSGTPNPVGNPAGPQPLSYSLPAGSVVRVTIPTLTGPAQIVHINSHTPQLLPQPGGTTAPNAATAPQLPQGVLAPGLVLQGSVQGRTDQGQLIVQLQTPASFIGQTVALNIQGAATAPGSLPTGTQLQLQILGNGAAQLTQLTLPPAAAQSAAIANLGARWDGLTQTLQLLQQASPSLAQQARLALPMLANFLPGLGRLLEGIRDRDSSKLLGTEASRLAAALGPDLNPDLQQLQQLLTKNPEDPGQWRGFFFPYLENPDGYPQQGSFFFRRENEEDPRNATATRFVAELELSQLGKVQLDGLLTYPELWLKLRLQQPIPDGFAANLHALITPMLSSLQLQGGISVDYTPQFPLSPTNELRQNSPAAS